jgi:naphthalene 1,2-dioxygenase ferredoxin reductase component
MPPQVTIDDTAEVFSAEDGETLLAAAQRSGIAFPYSCQAGNCGSCKCELIEGDVLELEYSEYALTEAERAQGIILACRSQVWGDTRIRRLGDEDIVMHPSRILNCTVVRMERLTHDITGLWLRSGDPGRFIFSAGQYASLRSLEGVARPYSMASPPGAELLEFHVRHVPGGQFSGFVASRMKLGDPLVLEGPQGSACLREHHDGPVLLMAGGSGLAPIKSVLLALLERPVLPVTRLYFGVRAERDVYDEAFLRSVAERHPQFSYRIVLSEETRDGRGSGLVHERMQEELGAVDDLKAYLAGPPVMVEAATAALKLAGMAARDIHADAFYAQA